MDAATLRARINAGYNKAASRVGESFGVYRPASVSSNPIVSGNLIGSVFAAFAVTGVGFNFEKPSGYKNPLFNGLFDATSVLVGDYLVNTTHGTFFVAQLQDIVPPLCVQCNRVVSVYSPGPAQPTGSAGFGAQATYSGSTKANQTAVVVSWPASIILDARGRQNEGGLPLDLPNPYWSILLPPTLGVDVRTGMIVEDDQGRRYLIAASENSAYGWRISAQQAVS